MRQWLVTLQGLPASGRSWDAVVSANELSDVREGQVEAIAGLAGDVPLSLSLVHKGNLFCLSGHWQCQISRTCSRCTAPFEWQVEGDLERVYQLGVAQVADTQDFDDPEGVYEYLPEPGELDLLDVLREDIWLAWKADVICSDSCKGLCADCGSNLNTGTCCCKKDNDDHPFAVLRKLKLDD